MPRNVLKLQLIRNRLARLLGGAPLGWILAALVVLDGYLFLQPGLSAVRQVPVQGWRGWLAMDSLNALLQSGAAGLPRLMLGAGLQIMALGLILRARIAWAFSLLLLIAVGVLLMPVSGFWLALPPAISLLRPTPPERHRQKIIKHQ